MLAAALASSASRFDPLVLPGASGTPIFYGHADNLANTIVSGEFDVWSDLSGAGNHVSAPAAGNRPAVVSSWRNGLAAAGQGGDDLLIRNSIVGGNKSQPITIVGVGEFTTQTSSSPIFVWGGASRADLRNQVGVPAVTAGAVLSLGGSTPSGVPFVWSARFNGASSSSRLVLHGQAERAVSGNPGAGGLDLICLLGSGGLPWTGGKMAACVIYTGSISDADQTYLINGFASRYAIAPSP